MFNAIGEAVRAYDYGMASLYKLVGDRFVSNEATGRRELVGIGDDVVAAFSGSACIPDKRFHQVYGDRMVERR